MKRFIAGAVLLSFVSLSFVPTVLADNNEVFLSLTRDRIPLSDAPTNTDVITSREFEKTSARTVGDVIASEPGIQVTQYGSEGALQSPSIRGFSAEHVLVVIDDVPQIPDATGTVDLSHIPLDNVDRIEIIRGGASAVYGPNAEGGVIHIITKKPRSAVDVQVTSAGGSYDTIQNRFLVGTQESGLQAQVTGSRDLSNGFQENSSYRNTDLSGFFAYDAKTWGKLSYDIEGSKGAVGLPSGTPAPIDTWNGTVERQAVDTMSFSVDTTRNNRLQYTNRLAGLDVTARVANNVQDLDTFQYGTEDLIHTEGRNALGKVEWPGYGAAGYEYYERRLDSNFYGGARDNAWGNFYEAYIHCGDWLHATPGVRYDADNNYGSSWSPRLEVVVKPTDMWKISASANRSFQAPTFADLYNPYAPNVSLAPEFTWSYNVGATVTPVTGLETTISLFHTDSKNRIVLDPTQNYMAVNVPKAYSNGFETQVSYTYKIIDQKIAYTYLDARGENVGTDYQTLPLTPKHKIDYRADVRLPWQSNAAFMVSYLHKQWTDNAQTGVEIPGYTVANLRLSKTVGYAEFFVACNNLFNRHYAETGDNFSGPAEYYPEPARNYLGGVTLRFLK